MRVDELAAWRKEGTPHTLLDVREPSEHAAERIEGAILIPLGELPGRVDEVPTGQPVVVHCRSGARSAHAAAFLRTRGFEAHNLEGGIIAWRRAGH